VNERAVIFDMDGVLIDSEPFWQEAEIEVFGSLGVPLTREMCLETMGLRLDEVVDHWYRRYPWQDVAATEVGAAVVAGVARRIEDRGEPLPGVAEAIATCRRSGFRLALASSSPMALIEAVLHRFGLEHSFDVVRTASDEQHGKPHPAIYLSTAEQLGVAPAACVAIEDSINGIIAAKAARMACVAVPAPSLRDDGRLAIADARVESLHAIDVCLDRLTASTGGTRRPGLLRMVDAVTVRVPSLGAGLAFYADALGHRPLWRNDAIGQAALALPDGDSELVLTTEHEYEPNWLVDSVDDAIDAFRRHGGTLVAEPRDIPVGRVAVVRDPFGNALVVLELSRRIDQGHRPG
jgi:mannitol-1-/sugar-/sorbitol-6-/2-deoxyglucose-6-phosphatase